MFTIVGLGNPGEEYARTRHNAGRIIIAALEKKSELPPKSKIIVPSTFMNQSGKAVAPYIRSKKAAASLVVVHDDLDLPLGVVRVSFGNSSGGHNGVKSIERAVKTKDFIKIRIGVSKLARGKAKKPAGEKEVLDFLLGGFSKAEFDKVAGPIADRVGVALAAIHAAKGNHVMGMNAVNGLPPV